VTQLSHLLNGINTASLNNEQKTRKSIREDAYHRISQHSEEGDQELEKR
jgi:hypothetical protein